MVLEGLAITRAVHDRYHASKRNPWNEVECGDHYARSMASHGVYLAACGYDYDGPAGHLGFTPKLTPEDFRCAFTAAEGWGTFAQKRSADRFAASIAVRHGRLVLRTLGFDCPSGHSATVTLAGVEQPVALSRDADGRTLITLAAPVEISSGQTLSLTIN
jgi:hypothetical protein